MDLRKIVSHVIAKPAQTRCYKDKKERQINSDNADFIEKVVSKQNLDLGGFYQVQKGREAMQAKRTTGAKVHKKCSGNGK